MKEKYPPGTKVKIPGLNVEAEVRPEKELIGKDVCRIACSKAHYDKGVAVPGTKAGFFCRVCNCELVLAPSGQRLEAMGGHFTCMECALKMMTEVAS